MSRVLANRQKLFRQNKMSQKKFLAEKKSEIFFQILENKKIFKILENIFWIFIF
jgi:hypothetical protein